MPSSLKEVTITGGAISASAFRYCNSLTSVTIPDSVTSIGDSAFSNCDSLTSVVIGDSVTSIGSYAFSSCDSLTSVTIPDSVTSIGERAFVSCDSLTSITVSANNTAYKSIDGNLYSKDGKTLIQYAIGKTATSFTIPDSVTTIENYAFCDCDSLTSVVIGDSVTSIGSYAFYNCNSLPSITIPDSVTTIGRYAFYGCNSLTSITIPFVGGMSNTHFGYIFGAINESYNNTSVPSSLKKVTITGGTISAAAFYNCDSLTSVVIGDSVTSIGRSAFYNCSSLTSIIFEDTSTWYRTTSSSDWSNRTNGTSTSVTSSSKNATYFKSTYGDYYWYKL